MLEGNTEETVSGLSEASIYDVLSSGDLFVLDEITCFCFIVKWFGHLDATRAKNDGQGEAYDKRLQSLERVIPLLRFHLISTRDLLQVIG